MCMRLCRACTTGTAITVPKVAEKVYLILITIKKYFLLTKITTFSKKIITFV